VPQGVRAAGGGRARATVGLLAGDRAKSSTAALRQRPMFASTPVLRLCDRVRGGRRRRKEQTVPLARETEGKGRKSRPGGMMSHKPALHPFEPGRPLNQKRWLMCQNSLRYGTFKGALDIPLCVGFTLRLSFCVHSGCKISSARCTMDRGADRSNKKNMRAVFSGPAGQ